MALPAPAAEQAFCNVSALEGGTLTALLELFITGATPGQKMTAPSLCFLIQHSERPEKFLFDLGIRSDPENYTPMVRESISKFFDVETSHGDSLQSLGKGGAKPDDIDFVCISHLHFDHTGNSHPFKKSTFVVGAECRPLLENGYPKDPNSMYAQDTIPLHRTRFISEADWKPLGLFPRAFDFYGDGSLYIIDSPGHLPGHVNILVRTSADGAWIYLAGDSAHNWKIITGENDITVGIPGYPDFCIHHDLPKTKEHLERIRQVWKTPRVRVLLAHDIPWYEENRDGPAFWPGKIESL